MDWTPFFRDDWLARRQERALEPELPIVDPHQHFWPDPERGYDPARFLADAAAGHRLLATVHMETVVGWRAHGPRHLRPVGETELIVRLVDDPGLCSPGAARLAAGIVGAVALDEPVHRLDEALSAHIAAGEGRFRGVRWNAVWHDGPNPFPGARPDHLTDPANRRGLERVAAHGLTCDVFVLHHQLEDFARTARETPHVTFVLNHLGGFFNPAGEGAFEAAYEGWRRGVEQVATATNVVVKLGGLANLFFGAGWRWAEQPTPPSSEALAEAYEPFVRPAIQAFGPNRCMFESNYPVDRQQVGYTVLWNAFKRLTTGMADEDRRRMLSGVASRIYRLD